MREHDQMLKDRYLVCHTSHIWTSHPGENMILTSLTQNACIPFDIITFITLHLLSRRPITMLLWYWNQIDNAGTRFYNTGPRYCKAGGPYCNLVPIVGTGCNRR